MTLKALRRIHPPEYLEAVHKVETLTSIMGAEIGDHQVDRLIDKVLPSTRIGKKQRFMATDTSDDSILG